MSLFAKYCREDTKYGGALSISFKQYSIKQYCNKNSGDQSMEIERAMSISTANYSISFLCQHGGMYITLVLC